MVLGRCFAQLDVLLVLLASASKFCEPVGCVKGTVTREFVAGRGDCEFRASRHE